MTDPKQTEVWQSWVLSFEIDRGDMIAKDNFRLLDQGRMHIVLGNHAQARALYEQARDWAMHARVPDARRVQAEAALCLGDLGRLANDANCQTHYDQARFLFEALSQYNLGVVSHRLATWHEQNSRLADAWREYNFVLTLWRELVREAGRLGNKRRYQKFQNQIEQLESQIDSVVSRMGASVASSSVSEPPKEVGETGRKTKTNKPKRVWDLGETHVSVFPIYADIAAGNGLWISDDSSILDFAEFDHLLIKNQPHKLVNLLGSDSMIRLSRGYLYGISKVVGNSMNLASIESGDYVLFRQLRDLKYQPSNGDIVVAAVIKDGERFGTVKRFRGVRPNESLEPESTESHGSIPFASTEIDIIGQVIAVLKATESD